MHSGVLNSIVRKMAQVWTIIPSVVGYKQGNMLSIWLVSPIKSAKTIEEKTIHINTTWKIKLA